MLSKMHPNSTNLISNVPDRLLMKRFRPQINNCLMILFPGVCWIPLGTPCGSVGAHQEPIIVTSPEDHISDSHLQQT